MTTVATKVRHISDLEGFDIIATKENEPVDVKLNGVLKKKYPFEKMLKGAKRVSEWRAERFEKTYRGYSCDVLKGDGTIAANQTTLKTVRATYEEDGE